MRARSHDPQTSQRAAAQAALFSGSHCDRIQAALEDAPLSAKEISRATGLTVVQVDRRLPELERQGKTQLVKVDGMELTRNGYRVWRLTA